ncbi:circadian clock protein KaiC [Gemmatirosa kalamazoonensis]|uniref:non-specific serine/threonine protein kinase n=1 Tax=Gemmatirosa kalamazoonensis TaxID=861299 RepID=W0RFU5_9BACT|nr:circadian clock protein KaiC [Gemmatirosa kalamazoonensis]AHG88253.1 circadian clock protein KaiC [Gemmatirosa kalamazoonensis]
MTSSSPTNRSGEVTRLPTGIPGFDIIAGGGLPRQRATLVAGTAGSAKTIFATHFLAGGITTAGEAGVFVTFEDAPEDVRRNVVSFGWDIPAWERAGKWTFIDATPDPSEPLTVVGAYDLGALVARIEHAVKRTQATRVVLDSLNALFLQHPDRAMLRSELLRLTTGLKQLGVTLVFTGERTADYGEITRFGIEEFVADNVVILRNVLADERRRRTMEILKFRGAHHERGEVPFTIQDEGIVVIPLTAQELTQTSSTTRISSGIPELDAMCGGGFFRDSIILCSGATGTGKTLLVTQFLAGGFARGERCLLFAFEESRDQLYRNAEAWGMDFQSAERDGLLRVENTYPHAMPMEDHLVRMRRLVDEFRPSRVAVDSLSALERVFTLRSFREFVISFTSFLKQKETAGLLTSTTPNLLGGGSVTEKHISTLTDSIILLRYVELDGQLRRSIAMLKMRGSLHDHDIREYEIDGTGMHIRSQFRGVHGILSGMHTPMADAAANEGADAGT